MQVHRASIPEFRADANLNFFSHCAMDLVKKEGLLVVWYSSAPIQMAHIKLLSADVKAPASL